MMTDPIADMLTRIRNAQMTRKRSVSIPFSKIKFALLTILSDAGYIGNLEKKDGMPAEIIAELKYNGNMPAITKIVRESKPGHRMYRKVQELPHVLNGYGLAIVSTSQGIMTVDEAKKKGLGGEVICSVY